MLHVLAGQLERTVYEPLSWAGEEEGLLAGGCVLMVGPTTGSPIGYDQTTRGFSFGLLTSHTHPLGTLPPINKGTHLCAFQVMRS